MMISSRISIGKNRDFKENTSMKVIFSKRNLKPKNHAKLKAKFHHFNTK